MSAYAERTADRVWAASASLLTALDTGRNLAGSGAEVPGRVAEARLRSAEPSRVLRSAARHRSTGVGEAEADVSRCAFGQ
jgi:hypothetical protein